MSKLPPIARHQDPVIAVTLTNGQRRKLPVHEIYAVEPQEGGDGAQILCRTLGRFDVTQSPHLIELRIAVAERAL